jgi:Beta-lactamase enzyme family
MKRALTALLILTEPVVTIADYREFCAVAVDSSLTETLAHTAGAMVKQFPKLSVDNLAMSVVDLTNPESLIRGDYHGNAPFYPASVVKLFFMVAIFHQGHLTPEIERALHEMITVSDNDAAGFLVDVLTDTTSGSELGPKPLETFIDRRRSLNRYFNSLGYDVSVMLKPWSFGPFGRDMQIASADTRNRNRVTSNAVASLLFWIVQRHAISTQASEAMLALLERPLAPPRPTENQVKEYLGAALPEGSRLWSKEGDTSEVRHDSAIVELPGGRKFILVVLTRGAADDPTLLPAVGRRLLAELDSTRTQREGHGSATNDQKEMR